MHSNHVKAIRTCAFYQCHSLKEIKLSATLQKTDIKDFTDFCIKDGSCRQLAAVSAVCYTCGTLYMFSKSSGNERQLVLCDLSIDIGNVHPVSLFGGFELNSSNSNFNDCYSENGGGGAFFIYNTIKSVETKGQVNLINCTFTRCKSYYGGAVYIYHASEESPILVQSCKFIQNEIYSQSDNSKLTGGSAIYITAKNALLFECIFRKNIGKGGSIKITDDLSNKPEIDESHLLQHSSNKTRGSVLIKGCQFEINQKSDCSLFYSNKRQSLVVEVKDCVFTGSLKKDAHYIDGHLSNSQTSNLFINSCTFSANEKMALGKNIAKQSAANNKFEKNNEYSWMWIAASTLAVAAVVVVVITIIILKRKKVDDDTDEIHDTNNSTLI